MQIKIAAFHAKIAKREMPAKLIEKELCAMQGAIVQLPEMWMVGASFTGPFQSLGVEMPKLWDVFSQRVNEIGNLKYPLCFYGVSDESKVGSYQLFTEYISVEVAKFDRIPEGMFGFTIPARSYALFTHQGPMDQVQSTYHRAFDWIKRQGLAVEEKALRLERYDERYLPPRHAAEREENAYDILIPLA
ncbi:GyrI-like domain-containing protein [Brevibacillus borstelensis]|uniref:GyrI-like domain-containing protein n=1 Tax=Brevibacillus borstelensis TaxID=45462 RepID=UPI001E60A774|nr:GyrI-like domain-containing protein [Brevibacillus borstelensis]